MKIIHLIVICIISLIVLGIIQSSRVLIQLLNLEIGEYYTTMCLQRKLTDYYKSSYNSPTTFDLLDSDLINHDVVSCSYIDSYGEEASGLFSERDFSIMHLNNRGLYGKQDELEHLINSLGGKNKVNVIALNETWFQKETQNKVSINGYNLVNKVHPGKKGGGVSIAVEEGIKYRRREDIELSNLTTIEHVVIEIQNNNDNIIVCSAYRAPNSNSSQCVTDFELMRKTLIKDHKQTIVAMDHNMNFLKFNTHNKTHEFVESSIKNDLYPSITKPTRVTYSTATLIDNIFC